MIILILLIGLYLGTGLGMAIVAIEDNYYEGNDFKHPVVIIIELMLIGLPMYLFVKTIEWRNK